MKKDEKISLCFFATEVFVVFLISLAVCSVADPITAGANYVKSWVLLFVFIGVLLFLVRTENMYRKQLRKKAKKQLSVGIHCMAIIFDGSLVCQVLKKEKQQPLLLKAARKEKNEKKDRKNDVAKENWRFAR